MNLSELNAMREEGLASWLVERLSAVYCDDPIRRHEAFDLTGFGIPNWESPIDAIGKLCGHLDLNARPRLRKAIGLALKQVDPATFPARAVTDLVMLVGVVEAHESLDAVVTVAADGGKWGPVEPSIWLDAISVLKGLLGSEASYQATRRIVSAQAFPDHYAFDAYQALVAGEPTRWVEDFLLLESRFGRIESWQPAHWERRGRWFDYRIGDTVEKSLAGLSLQTIANGLIAVDRENDHLDARMPLGRLITRMFCQGPYRRYWGEQSEIIFGLEDRTAREVWPSDLDTLDTFLWAMLGDSHDELPTDKRSIKHEAANDSEAQEFLERRDHLAPADQLQA